LSSVNSPKDLVPIAQVVKPRGLKGELKVFLYNKSSDTLNDNIDIWLKVDNHFNRYTAEYLKHSFSDKYVFIKFKDINTREDAELVSNRRLYVSRMDFPNNDGGFYLVDLIDFIVQDEIKANYGKVIDVINLPTNDALLINYKGREIMIPLIDNFIKLFDFENKLIVVKNSDTFLNKC
jgi:16S rRNA processing protein RimM